MNDSMNKMESSDSEIEYTPITPPGSPVVEEIIFSPTSPLEISMSDVFQAVGLSLGPAVGEVINLPTINGPEPVMEAVPVDTNTSWMEVFNCTPLLQEENNPVKETGGILGLLEAQFQMQKSWLTGRFNYLEDRTAIIQRDTYTQACLSQENEDLRHKRKKWESEKHKLEIRVQELEFAIGQSQAELVTLNYQLEEYQKVFAIMGRSLINQRVVNLNNVRSF